MADIDDDVTILITGDSAHGRYVIANVISDALEEAGFTDVNLVNPMRDPVERGDTPTLLETVNSMRPEFFNKPLTVITRPAPGETDDETTGDPNLEAPDDDLTDALIMQE